MKSYIQNISNVFAISRVCVGRILSVLFLLALSSSVFGDSYYLLYDNTDGSDSNFTNSNYNWSGASTDSGNNHTWTLSLKKGGNCIYFASATNYSNVFSTAPTKPAAVSPIKNVYNISYNYSSTERRGWKLDADVACTVVITYNSSDNSLVIGIPSWRLCGEFTDLTPANAPEFTGSGSALSLQVYLPANTTYAKQTENKGFQIVSSVNESYTWYGNSGQMNYDTEEHHTNWTFEENSPRNNSKNCGLITHYSGYYTFTFNTSTKKLTVTYPDAPTSVPTVYWGAAPTTSNSAVECESGTYRQNIVASAYIASQGCGSGSTQDVDEIRVRFWDANNPSVTDVVSEKRTEAPYYLINTAYPITIPYDNEVLLNCLGDDSKIVMEVAAHNANGWSAYSDQMEIQYSACPKFIVNNLTPSDFTACDGAHQFLLKNMVQPVPDTWTLEKSDDGSTYSSVTASEHFTLKDGVMVWNTDGKDAGTYYYRFTFNKTVEETVFPTATATIQFTYNVGSLSDDIDDLTVSSATTTPWTEVTLTATYPADKLANIVWSVNKTSGYNLDPAAFDASGTSQTAVFKGSTVLGSTVYTITAKGTNAQCATTEGKSVTVTVNADTEPCGTATQVKRAANPVVAVGPRVTLNGYVKYFGNGSSTCVDDYTTYGFCYSTEEATISSTTALNVSGVTYKSKTGAALTKDNRNFSYTVSDGLSANTTYYYKAYIVSAGGSAVFSDMGSFTTGDACQHPTGDPINYYIDDDYDDNDPCALQFKTLADAITNLKTHTGSDNDDWWDDTNENNMLKVNVIFNVYPGTYGDDISSTINLKEINKYSSSITPTKRLTIKGTDATNKPVLYGLDMTNSRWITVQNVKVMRETTGTGLEESSIIIGFADKSNTRTVGEAANSDLKFIKCDIVVDGFTCIHANGVDGFYMEGCNLKATRTTTIADNDRNWGASIKFMNSKNIQMLRNNFRGSHANNIFYQNSRNTLIMNNVFWNDNEVTYSSGTNSPSFIRLVNFQADNSDHTLTKIGIYYNTFYLANSTASGESSKTFDFVAFSGAEQITQDGNSFKSDRYDVANIEFKYNNCYSYSTSNSGNNGDQFHGKTVTSTFTDNNFWSAKSGATSSFAFGSSTQSVDMSLGGGMMCSTAPYDPDGLVIKGSSLNLGSKITTDVSGFGAASIYDDRLRDEVRPASGSGWTYGAYQQTTGEELSVIFWLGTQNTTWDNRNNWYKLVDGEYQLVTCVDDLSDNLKVIIPEQTGNEKKYPIIPVWTATADRDEGVYTKTTNQFAKTIDVQYGASILGVQNLKEDEDTYRYFEGVNHLEADRKEWLMVGTVIRPFKDAAKAAAATDTTARLVMSGDFYKDKLPHVYMQKFGYNGSAVNWDSPFTQLDENVPVDKCFTIFCADQYGPNKRTARMYYGDASIGAAPIEYTLTGRYAAESALPSYSFSTGNYYFVNNYYPANVKASAFSETNAVKYYDYTTGGWNDITLGASTDVEIRPQNGILVITSSDNTVTLDEDDYTDGSTQYKSAAAAVGLTLGARATATGKGSNIGVWQNYKNILKAENGSDQDVCELYMPYGDVSLSTLNVADADTVIALGVHNKLSTPMSVRFDLIESSLLSEVYLEDRSCDPVKRYDLLAGEAPYFASLPSGRTEGRFYLVIGDGSGSDVITDVHQTDGSDGGIDIYANGSVVTVSASDDVTIKEITITDMAGRSQSCKVSNAHYFSAPMNVACGTYIVSVVADSMKVQKKVVIK